MVSYFRHPFQMKLGSDLSGREPDILFIAREHLDRLQKCLPRWTQQTSSQGSSAATAEPATAAKNSTSMNKVVCANIGYLYYLRRQAEFYQLGSDGIYRSVPVDAAGIYRSTVLNGLWLKVEWLWQEPLPLLLAVLKEWGLV